MGPSRTTATEQWPCASHLSTPVPSQLSWNRSKAKADVVGAQKPPLARGPTCGVACDDVAATVVRALEASSASSSAESSKGFATSVCSEVAKSASGTAAGAPAGFTAKRRERTLGGGRASSGGRACKVFGGTGATPAISDSCAHARIWDMDSKEVCSGARTASTQSRKLCGRGRERRGVHRANCGGARTTSVSSSFRGCDREANELLRGVGCRGLGCTFLQPDWLGARVASGVQLAPCSRKAPIGTIGNVGSSSVGASCGCS
mmetsp:Transcript_73655/g.204786  ORF Transcript_73655/g.204786 Transcript_73655/m.204786 type:complete len:262 (-) Transcript_73655:668-1453(-)